MPMHTTWSDWSINHASNNTGNRNLQAFSNSLSLGASNAENLWSLVKEIKTVILTADASRNIMIVHSPKKLWRNKDLPIQQSLLHAWFRIPSSLHPHSFKHCSRKLQYCCSNSSRPFRIWDYPRHFKHSSPRRKWHRQFWRLSNFNPGPNPNKCHPNVQHKRPFQIDPTHDKDCKRIRHSTDWEQCNSTRKCNQSLRQPQCLALQHESGINKWRYSVTPDDIKISMFCNNPFSALHQPQQWQMQQE